MPEEEPSPAGGRVSQDAGFLLNVNLVFASTIASYAASFFVLILIARTLGPEGRGLTSLFQAAVVLLFAILSLGASVAAVFFVSRRDRTGREALEIGAAATVVAAAGSGLGVALVALLAGGALLREGVPYYMVVFALVGNVQFRLVEAVLRGQGRFMAMNAVEVAMPSTYLALLIAAELLGGLTVERAIVLWSVAPFLPAALGYALLGPSQWPRRPPPVADVVGWGRFGLEGQLGNVAQLLNYRLDSYMVLLFAGAAAVGHYAVAVALAEGLWFIANSVATVLLPRLTAAALEDASRTASVVCRNTMAVTALAGGGLAAVSPVVVPLVFGRAFEEAVAPFLWLLPGVVLLSGGKILSAYVFSRGRPLYNSLIALAALGLTVVLDLALIPSFGASGAGMASSLAYALSLWLTGAVYVRLSALSALEALLPRPSDARLYVEGAEALLRRLRPGAAPAVPGERG
jgi:O-antigen/teichoic acid export membrane protein